MKTSSAGVSTAPGSRDIVASQTGKGRVPRFAKLGRARPPSARDATTRALMASVNSPAARHKRDPKQEESTAGRPVAKLVGTCMGLEAGAASEQTDRVLTGHVNSVLQAHAIRVACEPS
jgi:hypothetical protein